MKFQITDDMRKAGMSKLILDGNDFVVTFSNGVKKSISASSKDHAISDVVRNIKVNIKDSLNKKFGKRGLEDIESQLIDCKSDIFPNISPIPDDKVDSSSLNHALKMARVFIIPLALTDSRVIMIFLCQPLVILAMQMRMHLQSWLQSPRSGGFDKFHDRSVPGSH